MNSPSPHSSITSSFRTKTLERLQLGVNMALSKHFTGLDRSELEINDTIRFMADELVMQLRGYIWSDPDKSHKKVHSISYTKAHPTWKHALVASLPEGSFRRRWAHFFWEIPFDYANTLVTHKVEVYVPAVFPEAQVDYPKNFGRVHFPISITPLGVTEEVYYG